jgi:hypothetical protein
MQCGWDEAWIGICKNEAIEGSEYCAEHNGKKCGVCGEQANRECPETCGLVCGFPLCPKCQSYCTNDGHGHRVIPDNLLEIRLIQKGELGCGFDPKMKQTIYESLDGRKWEFADGLDHWYSLYCKETGEYVSIDDCKEIE